MIQRAMDGAGSSVLIEEVKNSQIAQMLVSRGSNEGLKMSREKGIKGQEFRPE